MTKAEKTRKHILEKSAALFNLGGFDGTSMKDIMTATQMSKGALYGHFQSKEEIALAAFKLAVEKVLDEVGKRTKVIDNTLDKLKAVVYFYKERILNPPVEGGCPIQNTAVDTNNNHEFLKEEVKKEMDAWIGRMIYTLEKGMSKGQVRIDLNARDFSIRFIGCLEGGIMMAELYKDVHYFDVVAQQLVEMIDSLAPIK